MFLGFRWLSNTYIYATESGVKTGRPVQRKPIENRWKEDLMASLTARPWMRKSMRTPQVTFDEGHARHEPLPPDQVVRARNFKITVKDIQHKWGYFEGCEQCDYIRRYGENRAGSQHSPACRARILSKMADTPESRAKLEKLELRLERALAEDVEREDQKVNPMNPQDRQEEPPHKQVPQEFLDDPEAEVPEERLTVEDLPDEGFHGADRQDIEMDHGEAEQESEHGPWAPKRSRRKTWSLGTLGSWMRSPKSWYPS